MRGSFPALAGTQLEKRVLTTFDGVFFGAGVPIINASGTFDAIAAHRAFGDTLYDEFPFSAFVTKTVTLSLRR